MATVRFGPIVQSASGALGSVVFSRQGGSGVVRMRPMRVDRESGRQLEVRAQYAAVVLAWRGLTNAQRRAWWRCAQAYKRVDGEGVARTLTGWLAFSTVNLRAAGQSYGLQLDPEVLWGDIEKVAIRLDVWPGGPVNLVNTTGTATTTVSLGLMVQRWWRTYETRPARLLAQAFNDRVFCRSSNVTAGFAEVAGAPGVNEYVGWECISHLVAWPSSMKFSGVSRVLNVSGELVTNGDMELPAGAGGPTGWSIVGAGTVDRVSLDTWGDLRSLKWLHAVGAGNSFLLSGVNIDVSVAGTYVVRFAIKVVAGVGYSQVYLLKQGEWSISFGATPPAADGLWHEQEWSCVVPAGKTVCQLDFASLVNDTAEVYLDNVSVRRNL